MGGGMPKISAPTDTTTVNRLPTQTDILKTEQARKENTGSGISQIASKIEGTKFGQDHPFLGKLSGGLLQGLATLGDVGLRAVAPSVDIALPGTSLHHLADLHSGNKQIAANEAAQESEAQQREHDAMSAHEAQETAGLPQAQKDTHDVSQATIGNLSSEARDRDAAANNPTLAVGHAHAVQKAINEGRDPSADPIVKYYERAMQATVPGFNKPEEAPKTISAIRPGQSKPHEYAWNPKTKAYDIDEGEHYERPMSVNVGVREDRAAKTEALKTFQPALDSAERMNVMADSYEKAIKDHDQQAMLNLLANHLGMTMGLQKGARITRDLYQEAAQSTPWLQKIGAKFDKDGYLSGVTLNPNQMRQMVDLGRERYAEDIGKARSSARYLGVQDDGPERIPGAATINYYVGKANGDAAKAKQLAAQDGWTVK